MDLSVLDEIWLLDTLQYKALLLRALLSAQNIQEKGNRLPNMVEYTGSIDTQRNTEILCVS